MKLYIMEKDALETLKSNLPDLYGKYHTEPTNKWITDYLGKDPFKEFKDIPDFSLTPLDGSYTPGEIEQKNSQILFENLSFLSESQASDERLWAGLCHSTFYDYIKKRWKYGYGAKLKDKETEAGAIKSRFFYNGSVRGGYYRNTFGRYWWVGHNTYNQLNTAKPFENLDIMGSADFLSKVSEIFYSFNFTSNPSIRNGIFGALKRFEIEGKKLSVRDHLRPAMSYLNAIGGSVVLDCLHEDDISDLFYDAISSIMQGDDPTMDFGSSVDDIEDTGSTDTTSANTNDSVNSGPEVILGSFVTVRNKSQITKRYQYANNTMGKLPQTAEVFTGHKVGDWVDIDGEPWEIIDVSFQ